MPSIFAVELETLAMRAFGDLRELACLRLVWDRFIAGKVGCTICRHLDSVALETPSERDLLIQRLMGNYYSMQPLPQERSSLQAWRYSYRISGRKTDRTPE